MEAVAVETGLFENYERNKVTLCNEHGYTEEDISDSIEYFLDKELLKRNKVGKIHIVCIGTDKVLGDAYGPLTGSILKDNLYRLENYLTNVEVYGEIGGVTKTVNALNVNKIVKEIEGIKNDNDIIIALDASISDNNLFQMNIEQKPIKPGAGLNKKLVSVGHISIKLNTAIVNPKDIISFNVHDCFNNVRLPELYSISKMTALGVIDGIIKFYNKNYGMAVNY